MSPSRRMYGGFILFGVTFVVFMSLRGHHASPHEVIYRPGFVDTSAVVCCLCFGYAMYVYFFEIVRGDKHLQTHGTRGTAVVLHAKRTNTLAQTGQFAWEAPYIWNYRLRVTVPGRDPFEATTSIAREVQEGATVDVAVGGLKRRKVAILDVHADSSASASSHRVSPSTGGPPRVNVGLNLADLAQAATVTAEPRQVDALARLADLHREGALTDAEFAAEKARILDS